MDTSTSQPSESNDDLAHNLTMKSFRCTFCKRGFSNAQALGGHMNIHRRDRARLREFGNEDFLSLEISKSMDWEESIPPNSPPKEKSRVGNDESCDVDDDQAESLKPPGRLPFFADAPPLVEGGEGLGKHAERRKVELNHEELDLELRLGPEPHHHHANSK